MSRHKQQVASLYELQELLVKPVAGSSSSSLPEILVRKVC
jgi:hypothetical protein